MVAAAVCASFKLKLHSFRGWGLRCKVQVLWLRFELGPSCRVQALVKVRAALSGPRFPFRLLKSVGAHHAAVVIAFAVMAFFTSKVPGLGSTNTVWEHLEQLSAVAPVSGNRGGR